MATIRRNISRTPIMLALLLLAAVALSCSGGGGGGGGDSTTYTQDDYRYLYTYNAYMLDGYTIRWPSSTITVSAPDFPEAPAAFGQWPGVNFSFVSGAANVTVVYDSSIGSSACGVTWIYWNSAGEITDVDMSINPDQTRCAQGLSGTLTHEAAHAVGFLGHDPSDNIMNTTGSGPITDQNRRFMTLLYSMPAGTNINGFLQRAAGAASRYDPSGGTTYSIRLEHRRRPCAH